MTVTSKSTEKRKKKKPATQIHAEKRVSYPVCAHSKAKDTNTSSFIITIIVFIF